MRKCKSLTVKKQSYGKSVKYSALHSVLMMTQVKVLSCQKFFKQPVHLEWYRLSDGRLNGTDSAHSDGPADRTYPQIRSQREVCSYF